MATALPPAETQWVQIGWRGRAVRVEYRWSGLAAPPGAPVLVLLHEGLGSVAMWGDFPERLAQVTGGRVLSYSRPGYGRSTPRAPGEAWGADFMHRQADEVLPELLGAVGLGAGPTDGAPMLLVGHSDGGSIALLYAARDPRHLDGLVVLAPHILVEELSIRSIEAARAAYLETDLKQRLGRFHDDPDSPFWGWNDIWLSPTFRDWSIEAELGAIRVPVLAIQGVNDQYGTLEQIRGIARRLPGTQLLELPDCGHSPHRDQPEAVLSAIASFVGGLATTAEV